MDSTLQQLGGILLKAIPTVVLLLIVHVYLKFVFFRPLQKVLAERKQATEGTTQKAEQLLAKAEQTQVAIDSALRKTRDEIYQEQEEARKRWTADQTAQLDQARQQSHESIHQARTALEADLVAAKKELAGTSESLAEQIARTLLARKTA
jgi:F-type H+-transporting ATPase subunit b